MRIQTKFFEDIIIVKEQQWNFPKGILGFEDEKEFALLPIEGNGLFQVLQSIKTKDIAFIVANPYVLVDSYSFTVDDAAIDLLKIDNEEDVMALCVLSLKDPFETSTVNLQAPLVFNVNKKIAKQMVLNDSNFPLRYQIGKVEKNKGGE